MHTNETEARPGGMSYKFQRLRERLRSAIASGELNGKLPGERELAKRFHVNAKTLSKALTDLAAEGLLHRSIGRGTFIKGQEPDDSAAVGAWLLVIDGQSDEELIKNLKARNPLVDVVEDTTKIRPSFLNQFSAVIDLAANTHEAFIRDLLVRNIPVVTVGGDSQVYSVNAVVMDTTLCAAYLARDMILAGHRSFLAVERRNRTTVVDAIRRAGDHIGESISVDACMAGDVNCSHEYGITACICDSTESAEQALAALTNANIHVPGQISIAAAGWNGNKRPCSGYYINPEQKVAAVCELLRQGQIGRPTVLWLRGAYYDAGTTAPIRVAPQIASEAFPRFPMVTLATRAAVG